MNSFDKTSIIIATIICLTLLGVVKMATDYGTHAAQLKAQAESTKMQHICVPD